MSKQSCRHIVDSCCPTAEVRQKFFAGSCPCSIDAVQYNPEFFGDYLVSVYAGHNSLEVNGVSAGVYRDFSAMNGIGVCKFAGLLREGKY